MKKSLKIKFVKFELALAMQVLEMKGKFSDSPVGLNGNGSHILIGAPRLNEGCLGYDRVWILPTLTVKMRMFDSNTARDEYLDNVIKWISEEQFATGGKLEIGKPCMVSLFNDIDEEDWVMGRLLAILPEHIRRRYIIQSKNDKGLATSWEYARPLASFVRPKIDGDVYTWEMEVSE